MFFGKIFCAPDSRSQNIEIKSQKGLSCLKHLTFATGNSALQTLQATTKHEASVITKQLELLRKPRAKHPSMMFKHAQTTLITLLLAFAFRFFGSNGFAPISPKLSRSSTRLFSSQYQQLKRRNVQIPLLDITDQDSIIPLPASHLPNELATLQIYGIQLQAGVHKIMITDTLSSVSPLSSSDIFAAREQPTYGHIVHKNEEEGLIGAIGCAAEIVVATPSVGIEIQVMDGDSEAVGLGNAQGDFSGSGDEPMTVLCKGSFRFIVKEVIQSFPYPIVIVDELLDEDPVETSVAPIEYNDFGNDDFDDIDDDEEDEEDMYAAIDSTDLIPRTLAAMKAIVDQKINTKPKKMSPLEEAILQESGVDPNMRNVERNQAEEMAAIFDIFISSLFDIAPSRIERLYVVAIMATEFAGLDNEVRKSVLTMVDGVARLRIVLKEVEKRISMVQAKKITEEIVGQNDEGSKDLQIGSPSLPPWAKSIKQGTKIEYFWNEAEGWCNGVVVDNPVMVIDELIITVKFDDGETHKLPFQGDEKARWRPGGMGD